MTYQMEQVAPGVHPVLVHSSGTRRVRQGRGRSGYALYLSVMMT